MVASVFFLHCQLLSASEVGYTGKVVDQTRLAPDSLISPIPVFHGRFLSVETSRTTVRSLGVLILLDSPFFFCRDQSTPLLFGSKYGFGSAGFRWSCASNFGVLTRGADCTNV